MAVYDKNIVIDSPIQESMPKENESLIYFSDGAFYPYLKYFLNQVTKIPNSHIFLRDYAENNPFLEQGQTPKIYCEMYEFNTPCISGNFDSNGDMYLFAQTKYRIYFINDNWRAPFLFEATMKGNVDNIDKISADFLRAFRDHKFRFSVPKTITMGSKKEHKGLSVYPILTYDILMNGYLIQNIQQLENMPFDKVNLGVNLE